MKIEDLEGLKKYYEEAFQNRFKMTPVKFYCHLIYLADHHYEPITKDLISFHDTHKYYFLKDQMNELINFVESRINKLNNNCSMNILGLIYWLGYIEPFNPRLAKIYFRRAIQAGNTEALLNLGDLYADNSNYTYSFKLARKYYRLAIENDQILGYTLLGDLYMNNQFYKEASIIYKRSVVAGNEEDYFNWGHSLYLDNNKLRAKKIYIKMISENIIGYDKAMFQLARMYYNGDIMSNDPESKVYSYLMRAIKVGNTEACYFLGDLYNQNYFVKN